MKSYLDNNRGARIAFEVLADIISGLILGIALYNFAADAKFPLTGVSGVAMVFYQYFGWKIGIVSMVLNIPIILCTYKILGKKFMIKSYRTIIIQTLVMDFITPFIPRVKIEDTLLNALVVAALTGVGFAMIYMQNSSTGGVDFIVMAIKRRHPHMSLGKIIFLVDAFVLLVGGVTYSRSVEGLCYGFVICYVSSLVVDKVMISADNGMMCLIITNEAEQMATAIDEAIERGCTIFTAKGGYKGDERQVLMCACSNKQMYQVNKVAKWIDEEALIIITQSREIYGNGFKRFKP